MLWPMPAWWRPGPPWPGGVAGRWRVVTAALAVYLARGYPGGPVFVTLFVALYSLATSRGRRAAFGSAAVAAGGLVVVGEVAGTGPAWPTPWRPSMCRPVSPPT